MKFKGLSFVVIFCALLSVAAFAHASAFETYTYIYQGKTVSVPIGEIDGVRFNDVCLDRQKNCAAFKEFKKTRRPSSSNPKEKNAETAASDFCRSLSGMPLVLTSPRKAGSLFCVFQDLSMIDARALRGEGK